MEDVVVVVVVGFQNHTYLYLHKIMYMIICIIKHILSQYAMYNQGDTNIHNHDLIHLFTMFAFLLIHSAVLNVQHLSNHIYTYPCTRWILLCDAKQHQMPIPHPPLPYKTPQAGWVHHSGR